MKSFVVKCSLEFMAESKQEAEDIVLGLDLIDMTGKIIEESYVEVEEVIEV